MGRNITCGRCRSVFCLLSQEKGSLCPDCLEEIEAEEDSRLTSIKTTYWADLSLWVGAHTNAEIVNGTHRIIGFRERTREDVQKVFDRSEVWFVGADGDVMSDGHAVARLGMFAEPPVRPAHMPPPMRPPGRAEDDWVLQPD